MLRVAVEKRDADLFGAAVSYVTGLSQGDLDLTLLQGILLAEVLDATDDGR